ncbi:predicted GPI-anchored protein 58 [Miscanthus floridulus]|uniref:predicted GPI-anchored protein 58 n=1 Tax=Miscanthus floridulus TaxID=154761 RepID=UPI0034585D84
MPPMPYVPSAALVLRLVFMVYYRARRIGVPFDDDNIRDSLLNALRNLLGEERGGAREGPARRRRRGRHGASAPVAPTQAAVIVPASWSSGHGVALYHPPWPNMAPGSSDWVPVALAAMPPVAEPSSSIGAGPSSLALAASPTPATGSATAAATPLANGTAAAATPSPTTPWARATLATRRSTAPLRLFSREAGEILDPALQAPPPPPTSTPLAVNIADQAVSPTMRRTWISVPHGPSARAQASPRANGRVPALENGHASPRANGGGGASSSSGGGASPFA